MNIIHNRNIQLLLLIVVTTTFIIIDSFILHILTYNFVAFLILFSIFRTYEDANKRILGTMLYYLLLCTQISFSFFCDWNNANRIIAIMLIIPAFVVEFYFSKNQKAYLVDVNDISISFADFKIFSNKIKGAIQVVKDSGEVITTDVIKEVLIDLPRNCSPRYHNKGYLSEEYVEKATNSLDDPYVYIVLSDTGSAASSVIGVVTGKIYNHVSLSFDSELDTLISYNGGERITPPGLNAEMIEWLCKKEDASIMIYRLPVSKEQKNTMLERIKQIDCDGSAYNIFGMALKKSFRKNMMFCSQFVYTLLEEANAEYFDRSASEIRPMDLIELDYERKLEFVQKICLYNGN